MHFNSPTWKLANARRTTPFDLLHRACEDLPGQCNRHNVRVPLVMAGADIPRVSQLMGHSTIQLTVLRSSCPSMLGQPWACIV